MPTAESRLVARQLVEIIPRIMRTLAAEWRQTGDLLSPAHFGVLFMLHYHPSNLTELAEYQGVSLPTMSSTVSRLQERGWVKRTRSSRDRRVVMIELTPDGRRKLEEISSQAEERLTELVDTLPEMDLETVTAGLSVLRNIFDITESQE